MFYAYLIAIVVGAIVLLRVSQIDAQQNDKIEANASRSCKAIKGAGAYWKEVRNVEKLKLRDSSISAVNRAATTALLAALERVIARSRHLQCERGK